MTDFKALAERILQGKPISRKEALTALTAPDAQTFTLVEAASLLRRHHFFNTVKVNYLINLKSGLCPEDCTYCSQRLGSEADVLKYSWVSHQEALTQAKFGIAGGASRVCMVASGKGPSNRDVERVSGMIKQLKDQHPQVEVCACLGILKDGQAQRLKEAGADAYNHNLNTSEDHYTDVCSTHTYQERISTIHQAQQAGLSACSGLIVGMGQTDEQLIDAIFALKDLDGDSIPVNFLMPFEGTPLAGTWELTPLKCLRILATVRLVAPDREIRMAGGREMHLRSLQSVALQIANSLFLGDYLTSEGQAALDDLDMIRDNGFEIVGAEGRDLLAEHQKLAKDRDDESSLASVGESSRCGSPVASDNLQGCGGCSSVGACRPTENSQPLESGVEFRPVLRRRGTGTPSRPNA
ncbi:biotin synthase BioB [Rothia sp. (in: high G+C Gram-positive bacteria)]|uniref:biotin synthase BioB n=1 Tax=Rothia sp. (in: high G+C Gram-positive bacteria) TaxID=1885016 RepID=UPI000EC75C52|nr:biotin synthase BioB [Rothia sp. (in: high G+C Gram-positive bacteria)]